MISMRSMIPIVNNDNTITFIWVIVMAVVISMITNSCNNNTDEDSTKEGFYTYPGYYKKYCSSCGHKSRRTCNNCTNCGYCITASGYGECVPGDSSGPYFRSDCVNWEYGDPYDNYPYSHVFPTIKTYENYPYYRWNLRGPNARWGYRKRNIRNKLRNEARRSRNLRTKLRVGGSESNTYK
jgi:hypothetical protein